jgi:hypothetical protein
MLLGAGTWGWLKGEEFFILNKKGIIKAYFKLELQVKVLIEFIFVQINCIINTKLITSKSYF